MYSIIASAVSVLITFPVEILTVFVLCFQLPEGFGAVIGDSLYQEKGVPIFFDFHTASNPVKVSTALFFGFPLDVFL